MFIHNVYPIESSTCHPIPEAVDKAPPPPPQWPPRQLRLHRQLRRRRLPVVCWIWTWTLQPHRRRLIDLSVTTTLRQQAQVFHGFSRFWHLPRDFDGFWWILGALGDFFETGFGWPRKDMVLGCFWAHLMGFPRHPSQLKRRQPLPRPPHLWRLRRSFGRRVPGSSVGRIRFASLRLEW